MTSESLKPLTLCADDFSLNPAINAAILDLLAKKRLSAVGCMTQSPTWPADARQLLPWKGQVDIGLHVNLTHPFPNTYFHPLPLLMLQSTLELISKQKIRDSLCAQLDNFEQALQDAPDFIDGHQHVHMFPVVRDILVQEYLKRYTGAKTNKPWIRSLQNLPADKHHFKAKILLAMGAHRLAHLLQQNCIPSNSAFAGIYNFNVDENIDQRMREWITALPAGGLMMCHPGLLNPLMNDAITGARMNEYNYLCSEAFLQTLASCNIRLTRLSSAA